MKTNQSSPQLIKRCWSNIIGVFKSTLSIILVVGPLLTSCQSTLHRQLTGNTPLKTTAGDKSPASDWYSIYFTDPNRYPPSTNNRPDRALSDLIDQAHLSVDLAVYSFDLWNIGNALIMAQRRGVSVRVVIESANNDSPEIIDLVNAGIPVVGDRSGGLMHNKFLIVDQLYMCSGSMNFTARGVYYNNNNLICIRSLDAAQEYTNEFEEMFTDKLFGRVSPHTIRHSPLLIEDTRLEILFAPEDNTLDRLVTLISSAQESVHFLVYSFTADNIAAALIGRAQSGVEVSGVLEASQHKSNSASEYDTLTASGIDVRLDGNAGMMHHKVIIIDKKIVITGSYNFSASAEHSNDENTLIIYNKEIAERYLSEFTNIFNEANSK